MFAILSSGALALRHGPMLATRAAPRSSRSSPATTWMIALDPLKAPTTASDGIEEALQSIAPTLHMSGLKGKAMRVTKADIPTKAQVRKAVPAHCFKRDTTKSMIYAAISVAQSAACVAVGALIPLKALWAPVWLAYAAFTGTVWTGMWVVAHECGHGAFSDDRQLQDAVGSAALSEGRPRSLPAPRPLLLVRAKMGIKGRANGWDCLQPVARDGVSPLSLVPRLFPAHTAWRPLRRAGYALHTLLLVPYFSWQRSHAVHHQHTNHITKGETHVPVLPACHQQPACATALCACCPPGEAPQALRKTPRSAL